VNIIFLKNISHDCGNTIPKVAWLGLDTYSHQQWLHQEKAENLGCLAATCAIQLGNLEEAVELLELGHSVFWQQTASLWSDLKVLKVQEIDLAAELKMISQQLNQGKFVYFPSVDKNVDDNLHSMEDIGKKCCWLAGKWEELVESVRKLPQFRYFLRPVPFDQLC
jgi:hypothetical protein